MVTIRSPCCRALCRTLWSQWWRFLALLKWNWISKFKKSLVLTPDRRSDCRPKCCKMFTFLCLTTRRLERLTQIRMSKLGHCYPLYTWTEMYAGRCCLLVSHVEHVLGALWRLKKQEGTVTHTDRRMDGRTPLQTVTLRLPLNVARIIMLQSGCLVDDWKYTAAEAKRSTRHPAQSTNPSRLYDNDDDAMTISLLQAGAARLGYKFEFEFEFDSILFTIVAIFLARRLDIAVTTGRLHIVCPLFQPT